jgi:CDP-diacylglycerol---glycerol-3-phosphate 3-phosphatidyltransferase
MNLPNQLTLIRLLLTLLFLGVFFAAFPGSETLALGLFIAASITDHYDGKIARRDGLVTNFGILMDPLVDKIMICSAFIAFVGRGLIPAWMVVIIVARELAITGLRLLAASKSIVLAAEGYGKHKTVSQIVAIISVLVQVSHPQWGAWARELFGFAAFGVPWVDWVAEGSLWVAVFFTAMSGYLYLSRNRALYIKDL